MAARASTDAYAVSVGSCVTCISFECSQALKAMTTFFNFPLAIIIYNIGKKCNNFAKKVVNIF